MSRYRKRPVVIEADRWFKNGDHQKVVSYDTVAKDTMCKNCSHDLIDHGWISTLEGGHIVCPGDWIITGVKGEQYPCKPDIFRVTYEVVT